MGEKFPVCTASDVVRVIRKHGSKSIPIGTLKSIIEGAKLTPDDLR